MIYSFLRRYSMWIACVVIIFSFCLSLFSSSSFNLWGDDPGDSLIYDEPPHISAGYTYWDAHDYRLNPEHPPLIKMISTLPMVFMDIDYPYDHMAWQEKLNGQWDTGSALLHDMDNDLPMILFWTRLPIMLLFVGLQIVMYLFVKRFSGPVAALFAVCITGLSPTLLAHSHYVTTDVGIAFFIVLALYMLQRFIDRRTILSFILTGVAFGLMQSAKFSSVLFLPLLLVFFVVYASRLKELPVFVTKWRGSDRVRRWFYGIGLWVLMMVVIFITIGVVYLIPLWNMPLEKQEALIASTIHSGSASSIFARETLIVLAVPFIVVKLYVHYFLGVILVIMRASGGNTVSFFGKISSAGWWYYFPTVFFFKVPLAIHLFWLSSLIYGLYLSFRSSVVSFGRRCIGYIDRFPVMLLIVMFFVLYVASSLTSSLNIGVRHLMPLFPLLFFVSAVVWGDALKRFTSWRGVILSGFLLILIGLGIAHVRIYPSYLSHYNIAAGSLDNAYSIATDSNLDWGQDLYRLEHYVEQNNISEIAVCYFGTDRPAAVLGERYKDCPAHDAVDVHGWVAMSASFYAMYQIDGRYEFLNEESRREGIGYSIYLFYID